MVQDTGQRQKQTIKNHNKEICKEKQHGSLQKTGGVNTSVLEW